MTARLAYIRVAVIGEPDSAGQLKAYTVNEQHEAFDGAGFFPGYMAFHKDALVEAPLEEEIDECQLYYGGKKLNRIPK